MMLVAVALSLSASLAMAGTMAPVLGAAPLNSTSGGWGLELLPPVEPPLATQPIGSLHIARGLAPADRFGTVVSTVGDVDGDGVPDWAVGAPRAQVQVAGVTLLGAGSLRVFSGRSGAQLLKVEGDSAWEALGSSVAALGDLDGDGRADFAVGAPRGTPPSGSVQLRSGRDGGLIRTLVGRAAGDQFGSALAGIGDLDGDGLAELAVGAPYGDLGGTNGGELQVFSGADGSAILAIQGQAWDQLGRSVAMAGDLNGDGVPDIAVGVPFSDVGAFNGGSAYVLSGSTGARLLAVHGQGIGDQLGFDLAAMRDVDLDGTPDLLVAAPGADDGTRIDAGAAEVFSGVDGASLLRVYAQQDSSYLSAVDFLGDWNGDGRPELLVGAASAFGGASESGRVRVLSGTDGTELASHDGLRSRDWFGASVANLGDLDGDDLDEWAAGAPGHDDEIDLRGYVRVIAAAKAATGK